MDTCFYQIVDHNMSIHGGLFTSKIMALEAVKSFMRLNDTARAFYTIHRVNPSKNTRPSNAFDIAVTWDDIKLLTP